MAADGDTRTGSKCVLEAHKKCSWFARDHLPLLSLRPCPRRPALAPSDPGKPSVGSRCRHLVELPLRQQRPSDTRRWPAVTSFGGLVASASHEPIPRRFANRTTDPMLCHADPWPSLTLPPVLSSLGVRPSQAAKSRPDRKFSRREGCRSGQGTDPGNAPLRVLLRKRPFARRSSFSDCRSNKSAAVYQVGQAMPATHLRAS